MKSKVFIIAEAGVNHNGDINLAYKMIDVAKQAGVDAVKFQTFKSENLVSKFANKAEYQKKATNSEESQLQMLRKLELSYEDFNALKVYCESKGIMFLSTAFDMESIDFLNKLDMAIFKIPSGEITNLPYLRKINSLKKEVIISTGMCDLKEIQAALNILKDVPKTTVLHCNTEYPTPMTDVNLRAMNVLKNTFNIEVGYSDHTLGIEVPIAAVAMGATVIEKHFTLNKTMEGPDHKASLEPNELTEMVKAIRNIQCALGSEIKVPSSSEIKNKDIARKSIVAKRRIKKHELLTEENLIVKRPGTGISPMEWDKVIGTMAKKDFNEDELIEL